MSTLGLPAVEQMTRIIREAEQLRRDARRLTSERDAAQALARQRDRVAAIDRDRWRTQLASAGTRAAEEETRAAQAQEALHQRAALQIAACVERNERDVAELRRPLTDARA